MFSKSNDIYNQLRMREMRQRGAQEQLAHTFRPQWQRRLEQTAAGVYRTGLLVIGRLAASFGRRLEGYAVELDAAQYPTDTRDLGQLAD